MRIAVYARVSTQRQAHDQTIEQQLDRLRAHIRALGGSLPDENVFRDDGYSGARLGRPGLDRLRDRAAQRELDKVLITDPDRLARNYVHQMLLIEEFERFGCEIEFLDRPMSHDPHDQLLLQIRGAVAEYERSLIAERMRRGRQAKLRAGSLLPWTRAPYGLRINPDRPRDPTGVSVDAAESAIVSEMFAYYLEDGHTLFGLTKHLMDIQVPTPTGQMRWNVATIRGILTNPAYTGQVYAGRTRSRPARVRRSATHPIGQPTGSRVFTPSDEWIPVATIPAIITQEQFDRVQAKLAHNQQCASRNNKAHDYLLRALVSCGVCQLSCTGRTLSPGYDYYMCSGKAGPIHACRDERCSARYIPAHQLDDLVWQDLCQVLTHPEIIVQALQRAQSGQWLPQELQARRENLRKAQVNLNHQVDRLTEAYLGSVIPLAEYQRRRRELEQKSQALESQEKQLEAQVDRQMELTGLVTSMEDFCQRVQAGLADATFEQKRQLVELLIDRVVVTNEEVEIRYVIPTSSCSEHIRFCHLRKDYFNQPFLSIRQDGFFKRQLLGGYIGGIGAPAEGFFQRRDVSLVADHRGDLIPHLLDNALRAVGCAPPASHELDMTFFLTFNGVREPPLHAMGLQDSLSRLPQLRFVFDLAFASTARRCQGVQLGCGGRQALFQAACLCLGIRFRIDHEHTLCPFQRVAVHLGHALAGGFVALHQRQGLPLVVNHRDRRQGLFAVQSILNPGSHLGCRVSRQGQRSQIMMPPPTKVGTRCQCAQFAVPYKQQSRLSQDGQQPFNDRNIQAVIGLFTRYHIRRGGQSQWIQYGLHHFHLKQARVIFALAKLEQAVLAPSVIARYGRGVHAYALLLQVIHPNRVLPQVSFNRVPILGLAQLAQDNRQPVVGKVRVSNVLPRHSLQSIVRLTHPISHGQLPMVALRYDVRQPDHRHPPPTQSLLKPVAWNMPIQYLGQVQSQHDMDQQYKVVYPFGRES